MISKPAQIQAIGRGAEDRLEASWVRTVASDTVAELPPFSSAAREVQGTGSSARPAFSRRIVVTVPSSEMRNGPCPP